MTADFDEQINELSWRVVAQLEQREQQRPGLTAKDAADIACAVFVPAMTEMARELVTLRALQSTAPTAHT